MTAPSETPAGELPCITEGIKSLEDRFRGLTWTEGLFYLEPHWTVDPDPAAIEQTIQSLRPASTIQVIFLAQGAFNKVYDVKIDDEAFIIRVALPVDPYYKTTSEVSTMDWISRTAKIPVPRAITYQSSRENPIGFEWILMTKMPGKRLDDTWRSLSFAAKTKLVGEFAAYFACLFRNQLRGIGNIYTAESNISLNEATWPAETSSHSDTAPLSDKEYLNVELPDVGRIVSIHFFMGSNILRDVPRGPFATSHDWILSHLSLTEKSCQSRLEKLPSGGSESDDEDELDDATRTLEIVGKLKHLLPSIFPPSKDNEENWDHFEPSIMVHDDLNRQNILVHDDGELAAVLDWEFVSALPLWRACDYPEFLTSRPRCLEPDQARYKVEANDEPSSLYWEHFQDYEVTLLRDVFIDSMKRLEPGWVDVYNKSQRQRDFDFAVHNCDNEFQARNIRGWIDDLTSGVDNTRGLHERIDAFQASLRAI